MRKLIAIVIAGVAIVIVVYFARSPSDTATSIAAAPQREQPQLLKHEVTVDVTDTRALAPGQPSQVAKREVAADVTDTRVQPQSTARKNSPPAGAPLTVEQQERAACTALSERRIAGEKAARDAEPKDPAWAYPMEQKLREYMTRKLQSGQLELLGIDCKTTFCEIKALITAPEGSTEFNEGSAEFNAAISGVNGASWNDFTGMGTSATQESGKTTYYGHLTRPEFKEESHQTPAEAQAEAACLARSIEKQDRERAARDTQPKDTSWAEPMEQLLRQYLTTQLVKHPAERIDIDCRTTFCRITGSGRTKESSMAFQKAAQAAAEEPWASLRNGEGGGTGYGDSWKQEYFLYRQ